MTVKRRDREESALVPRGECVNRSWYKQVMGHVARCELQGPRGDCLPYWTDCTADLTVVLTAFLAD